MKKALLFFLVLVASSLFGQDPWFGIGGQRFQIPHYQIVIPKKASEIEKKAAFECQKYIELITGVKLRIVDEQSIQTSREIVIGYSSHFIASPASRLLDPDGFEIYIHRPEICIAGGSHKGTLYGVYEFLEKYVGCRFWAPGAEFVPVKSEILLPVIDVVEKPAFSSREVYYAGMDDQDFTDKMRSDRHAWKGGENWGMWVHTMFSLVPPEKYFDSHPEYYSLMAGKRTKTQLCLSNPDVLKITIDELKRRMAEKPGVKYWSVSQMDTYGSCECDACTGNLHPDRDPDGVVKPRQEGTTPSDRMVEFVNKVAAAFPDKVISTLAYQYTRSAPKNIKPASNVNIMLCTIECDRSKPLERDTSAGSFVRDLRDWAAISDNILVWDYVIQFTNMIAPFPNLPVLQPNINLFKKYGVDAVFEQGCHGTYSENQEMRQYILSKLLWNPDLNIDSISALFLNGYYGAAGPWIQKYLDKMEQNLVRSGKTLWIYAGPMQESESFLRPDQVSEYDGYFDAAEKAVNGDSVLMSRVWKARLPLQYAIIEIARKNITGPDGFLEDENGKWVLMNQRREQLDQFVSRANLYGVKTIHEAGLTPDDYKKQVEQFFAKAYTGHLAKGKPYRLSVQPAGKYAAEGPGTLTDGKRGSTNFHVLWQGFEENDVTAVIDFGEQTELNYVGAEFIQDLTSWIFYPEAMTVSVSSDGEAYRDVAVFDSLSFPDRLIIAETGKKTEPANGRYVKFIIKNIGHCPAWHIGHGGKAWVFIDELIVDKRK